MERDALVVGDPVRARAIGLPPGTKCVDLGFYDWALALDENPEHQFVAEVHNSHDILQKNNIRHSQMGKSCHAIPLSSGSTLWCAEIVSGGQLVSTTPSTSAAIRYR